MRMTLFDLFAKSPFGPMQDHMRKVMDCVRLVPDLLRALEAGDEKALNDLIERIQKAEHEADIIKNQIRSDVPKTLFTPVDRTDLLEMLTFQDRISDWAEDVAVLLSLRRLPFPKAIHQEFWDFVDQVMATVEQFAKISEELDELLEASFGGAEADRVMEMIISIGREEYLADRKQHDLVRKLLDLEDDLGVLNIILWMKVIEKVADLANGAEKAGNRIRLFLSK